MQEPESLFITFDDLVILAKKKKRLILSCAATFAFLAAAFTIIQPTTYEAEATFRELGKKQSGIGGTSPLAVLGLLSGESQSGQASSILKSRSVLQPLIQKFGMQAVVTPTLFCKEVSFEGEKGLRWNLLFTTSQAFDVYGESGLLGKGTLSEPFAFEGIQFTLNGSASQDARYSITLTPLRDVVKDVQKRLLIEADKKDKALLRLTYSDPDRLRASAFLNGLMEQYQTYLQMENDRFASVQIDYLEKRKADADNKLRLFLNNYAANLSSDLSQSGHVGFESEIGFLNQGKQTLQKRLLELELTAKRLQQVGGNDAPKETGFEGISSEIAQEFYIHYTKLKDQVEYSIKENSFIAERLKEPSFEITSLSALTQDPVSQAIIAKATEISLKLRDQNNRSQKEQERLKEELELEKGFLALNAKQSIELGELRKEQLQLKSRALQRVMLELTHQESAILEQQLKKLHQIMAKLPEKAADEMQVKHELELHQTLLKEISKLVESKNISHNLETIQAGALDKAVPPILPRSRHILLFTLLGALLGTVAGYAAALTETLARGLRASPANLKLAEKNVLGSLSKGLATLRRLSGNKGTLLLLTNNGPHYAKPLAELLEKQSVSVLQINLSFNDNEAPDGLLAYLEGKIAAPVIHHGVLSTGGTSRFGNEYLQSEKFRTHLVSLRKEYAVILATSDISPCSAEGESTAKLFDNVVVTVRDESLADLVGYNASFVFVGENDA